MMIRDRLLSLSITLLLITTGMMVLISISEELSPISLVGSSNASFAGGNGTAGNPYRISNVSQLQNMSSDLTAHYILVNNIDASDTVDWNGGSGFEPVGDNVTEFNGSLDGNSYSIGGLSINRSSENYVGLFGYLTNGTSLVNITISGANVTGRDHVGGLVGYNKNGSVSNCTFEGNCTGANETGGLIGGNYNGNITNCSVKGIIEGYWSVGGLVGFSSLGSNIIHSSSTVIVYGENYNVGGLVGVNYGGHIETCSSQGNISGDSRSVGGLIGYNDGTVNDCSSSAYVIGDYYVGGAVGQNLGTISDVISYGNVSGRDQVGGFVGVNREYILDCISKGSVNGLAYVGGFVGENVHTILSSDAYGDVNGSIHIGGFTGRNFHALMHDCHSSGNVTGINFNGGLIGKATSGIITNCTSGGDVKGGIMTGGLIGEALTYRVANCTSSGDVFGEVHMGGLIGNNGGGSIRNSYYCINSTRVNEMNFVTPYGIYENQYNDWINNDMTLDIDDYLDLGPEYGSYKVDNIDDLMLILPFTTDDSGYHFHQTADIDLSSQSGFYIPVLWSGQYDGRGFSISNLNITYYNNSYLGMFGVVYDDVVIQDVHIINAEVRGLNRIGGLVGYGYGSEIKQCAVLCNISGSRYVGGIIGLGGGIVIRRSYSDSNVSGGDYVGGLIGWNEGQIYNCYSDGVVNGGDWVGGLIGFNNYNANVENCYSTGEVRIHWYTRYVGGLVGRGSGRIAYSFWDNETSNRSTSAGGTPKTTWEMKNESTFGMAGWNLTTIWNLIDGESYPFLRWEVYPGIPDITTMNIGYVYEDELYLVDYNAISSLPGGGGALWELDTNANNWLSMEKNGVLSGTPLNEDVGTYWVNITASLNDQGYDFTNFTLTVINTNDDPQITTISLPNATEDEYFRFTIDAIEIDPMDQVQYWKIRTNSEFLYITPTGKLQGMPTNDDVGTWWVLINASDINGGFDEVNLTLIVNNTNDDPWIKPFEVPTIYEDVQFIIYLEAADIDPTEDTIQWTFETNAQFISYDQLEGTLSGTPGNGDVGTYWGNVSISDRKGGTDWINFTMDVLNVNDPPTIITSSLPNATEDVFYNISLEGRDIDPTLDLLTFGISDTNAGFLQVDPVESRLFGLPENNDVGMWWVNISVSDGSGGYDWRNYSLIVHGVNDPPTLNMTELTLTMEEDSSGTSIDLYDIFLDSDDETLMFEYQERDGFNIYIKKGIATIVPRMNWCGDETIRFTAFDGSFSISFEVSVIVESINDAPYHAKIFAKPAYIEGGNQTVFVNASDVDIPFGDELSYLWISNITGHIGNGQSINLSLPAGVHLITVTVSDIEGLSINASIIIEIIPVEIEDGKEDDDRMVIGLQWVLLILGFVIGILIVAFLIIRRRNEDQLWDPEVEKLPDTLLEE